ncbi:MAG: P1 family peptidase [Bryobacteraceae bacterium]|nr:P1 family peptidase [Bryobacteraceae bacterium]
MKGLTDIAGIKVGHASDYDGITGCTVILCERGAVAGVDIRGGATGTEEIDVISASHITPHVHAICLSGGSAFGLESASGVRKVLEQRRIGFGVGVTVVPIVPAAILFDLGIGKSTARPTREMGEVAASAAHDGQVEEGNVGAGTGATCGKALGLKNAMKAGIGTYTVEIGKAKVSALAAVNAYGDVLDPATGRILAGARVSPASKEFADTVKVMKDRALSGSSARQPARRENTTLVVLATDAKLNKVQASRLAQFASQGMVRSIRPVHMGMDGDVAFALSCGDIPVPLDVLCVAAAEAVAEAVARAVRTAKSLAGIPGLAG